MLLGVWVVRPCESDLSRDACSTQARVQHVRRPTAGSSEGGGSSAFFRPAGESSGGGMAAAPSALVHQRTAVWVRRAPAPATLEEVDVQVPPSGGGRSLLEGDGAAGAERWREAVAGVGTLLEGAERQLGTVKVSGFGGDRWPSGWWLCAAGHVA